MWYAMSYCQQDLHAYTVNENYAIESTTNLVPE
jgi:hypothetical protein